MSTCLPSPSLTNKVVGSNKTVISRSAISLDHHVSTSLPTTYYSGHQSIRFIQSESDFHSIADETLEDIQDAVETLLEDELDSNSDGDDDDDFEVNYASGVLTMALPPHGTWVLNKQTPNRQIWWSSPISGPRRYEYDAANETWVYTRDVDDSKTHGDDDGSDSTGATPIHVETLHDILKREIQQCYGLDLKL